MDGDAISAPLDAREPPTPSNPDRQYASAFVEATEVTEL